MTPSTPDPKGSTSTRRPPAIPQDGTSPISSGSTQSRIQPLVSSEPLDSLGPTPQPVSPSAITPKDGVPAVEQDDETPTIISSNAHRPIAPETLLNKSLQGRRLGHFELIEPVGVGGMAAVIRARDLDLGRIVALKILPPEMAVDPENITRFKQEGRAAARLDHENVARVYFCGEDQGLHFIAFEFVEGDNLKILLDRRGPLPVPESVSYLLQIATGLAHAMQRGVVHRDIKPSNILITPDGKAKIVDMGLARNLDPQTSVDGGLTQSGVTLGTFDYISPEQALEPRSADSRSDIYSLGCTFYHILTGQSPVPEGTAAKKLHFHQHRNPLDPRTLRPDLPDELTAILGRMMAKRPEDRYQRPEELIAHLLSVANQLQMPADQLPNDPRIVAAGSSMYDPTPLPPPPRLSPIVALAAILATIAVIFLTGGFGDSRALVDDTNPPLWSNDRVAGGSAIGATPAPEPPNPTGVAANPPVPLPNNPMPANLPLTPQNISTVSELLDRIRQPVVHLRLQPGVYDLTDGGLAMAMFEGQRLILEGSDPSDPPLIKLAYAPVDSGLGRPMALTLRGKSGRENRTQAILRGLHFEIVTPGESLAEAAAIQVIGMDQIELDRCTFVADPGSIPGAISYAAAVMIGRKPNPTPGLNTGDSPFLKMEQCYFGPGAVAVELDQQSLVEARDCAFGPSNALFRVRELDRNAARSTINASSAITLERCSTVHEAGAVVELDSRIGCTIEVGHCLFTSVLPPEIPTPTLTMPGMPEPEPARTAVMIRQIGELSDNTRYRPLRRNGKPLKNGYYQVSAARIGKRIEPIQNIREENRAISDPAAILLGNSPWAEANPLDPDLTPEKSFRVRIDDAALRAPLPPPRIGEGVLGAMDLLGSRLYDLPLPKVGVAKSGPGKVKIWDPLGRDRAEDGVFRSLAEAFASAQPGDEIQIRHNGWLEIEPQDLSRVGYEVTLKPASGSFPVLGFARTTKSKSKAMFQLAESKLTLENLQISLRADSTRPETTTALVSINGSGDCTLRNCIITLESQDDARPTILSLIDTTPNSTLDTRVDPRIHMENSWVRGRGDFLTVRPSRPFELELDQSLVALDGSLLRVDPASKMPPAKFAQVKLNRVTTFLTEHLAHLQALPRLERVGMNLLGLVPLHVEATGCLFAPASNPATAFIRFDRLESDSAVQERELLVWKNARQNIYGYSNQPTLIQVSPENTESMPLKPYDIDRWLSLTHETGRPFGAIKFRLRLPLNDRNTLLTVQPDDFRLISVTPPPIKLGSADLSVIGADIERLPRLLENRLEDPMSTRLP
ncbi:serine threonine protein kinase : Putative serine/threonine protein kinase OS=Gemmata sp. Wa1-1 PE=3 SV=1: Pkinase [Tuwongella immobilis]|uniref:Protein kinase domain-containing protein n=2 Tax=Tuwongella immobilis TaxID=692036 RepID=A0A6C2YHV9_9BACT|nr:serine threonine protein kinase : Putative serine/threonine protein kinase OS=Gemmata sp. Wa1-1 PE=3 SV=1: Pkinase [Tuwongella immobilis]VTR96708.1 serine threonine protein kinase : Putative serine/threonine protein kinase OS=Gemmata sp. Wa1-1 PE=3 SV=1: Pkinase [Tuwongella immobilis]